jgi:hypothetical protein
MPRATDRLRLNRMANANTDFRQLANFIWSIADLLRHDYKQADYGKVILPFTVPAITLMLPDED